MSFNIEINKEYKPHVRTHHVVIIVIIIVLPLCHSVMSHVTLILFHHASMFTLHNSLISRTLWLPQVWYYKLWSVLVWCCWLLGTTFGNHIIQLKKQPLVGQKESQLHITLLTRDGGSSMITMCRDNLYRSYFGPAKFQTTTKFMCSAHHYSNSRGSTLMEINRVVCVCIILYAKPPKHAWIQSSLQCSRG